MNKCPRQFVLLVVFTAAGCSTANNESSRDSGVPQEAYDAAKTQVLDIGFKNCGDYWGSTHPRDMLVPDTDYQFKNVRLEVKKNRLPLSEADKLNGIEWSGLVSVVADVTRQRTKGEREWSNWSTGLRGSFNPTMVMVKSKGKWIFTGIELLGAKAACPA